MFERNRVDNISEERVPVEIALADGTTTKGKLLVPTGKTVADALNGTGGFIEFEPYGGEKTLPRQGAAGLGQAGRRAEGAQPAGAPRRRRRLRSAPHSGPLRRRRPRGDPRGLFRAGQGLSPGSLRHRRVARRRCATTSPPWRAASTPPTPRSRFPRRSARPAPRPVFTSTRPLAHGSRHRGRWGPRAAMLAAGSWRQGFGGAFSLA